MMANVEVVNTQHQSRPNLRPCVYGALYLCCALFDWPREMMKIYASSQARETFAILARNHTHT